MGRPRKTPESEPDYLETGSGVKVEPDEVEADGYTGELSLSTLDELELRLGELEARIAEAGRRALFHAQNAGSRVAPVGPILADVGRALLFDSETPDAGAGVSGTAETATLGDTNA